MLSKMFWIGTNVSKNFHLERVCVQKHFDFENKSLQKKFQVKNLSMWFGGFGGRVVVSMKDIN